MKTTGMALRNARLPFVGIALFFAAGGVETLAAQIFQHGNSTATVEQKGGPVPSKFEITRYDLGQRIITQDGSNTDITVQQSGAFGTSDDTWTHADTGADRCEEPPAEERFQRRAADYRVPGVSSVREAFRQRMLDRMRSPFFP